MKYTLRVALNGTEKNPFHQWGFTHNPFPQIATAQYAPFCMRVQELAGDPIPDIAYIREKLKGWHPDFVQRCCSEFRKGEYVKFRVTWEEAE
jgi:hypothetical protein